MTITRGEKGAGEEQEQELEKVTDHAAAGVYVVIPD